MFHALDLGIGTQAFWAMSPRAVLLLQAELVAVKGSSGQAGGRTAEPTRLRLADLPKP